MRRLLVAISLLLAIAAPARANITIPQTAVGQGNTSSGGFQNATFGVSAGSTDTVFVAGGAFNLTTNFTSSSPLITKIDSNTSGGDDFMNGYRNLTAAGTAYPCTNLSATATMDWACVAYDLAGALTTSSVLNQHATQVTVDSPALSPSVTPTLNGCAIIAGVLWNSSDSNTPTVAAPFVMDQVVHQHADATANANLTFATASYIQGTAAAAQATFTYSGGTFHQTTPPSFIVALCPVSYTPLGGISCFASITPCGGPML